MESHVIITRLHPWDMAHRLPDHAGKCRRLHGHRYVAEIDIEGPIQPPGTSSGGMVKDFDEIKTAIDRAIGHWDHRCMMWENDPWLENIGHGEEMGIFTVPFIPTAENISMEIATRLQLEMLRATRVRVYETPNGWAEWRR